MLYYAPCAGITTYRGHVLDATDDDLPLFSLAYAGHTALAFSDSMSLQPGAALLRVLFFSSR